jgi:Stress-induced bacterial acidophilic repeat motif
MANEKASEAGKKGGQHSHGGSKSEGGGSSGNFANDREKASEAGKKGGAGYAGCEEMPENTGDVASS